MALFELEGVIVNNILQINQMNINENQVTGVVGQSGSGKSTFLRLLNRLDDPDNGEIMFKQQKISDLKPLLLRSEVVMVPQTPVIFDGSIRDNLQIGLTFSAAETADEKTLQNVMKTLNLDKDLDQDAEELSGGEKQRLALGRVMLMSASVYLLDEPTSALDDVTSEQVIGHFIDDVRQKGKSIVMVSHDHALIEKFADVVIDMDDYSKSVHKKKGDIHESRRDS